MQSHADGTASRVIVHYLAQHADTSNNWMTTIPPVPQPPLCIFLVIHQFINQFKGKLGMAVTLPTIAY